MKIPERRNICPTFDKIIRPNIPKEMAAPFNLARALGTLRSFREPEPSARSRIYAQLSERWVPTGRTVDRDKELRSALHVWLSIPGATNTATGGTRPGTRRVSQSQYLGQGQKVPRSPGSPRHWESRLHGECARCTFTSPVLPACIRKL